MNDLYNMNDLYDKNYFRQTFLEFDFDKLLQETDNNIVNSNEFYLQYKNNYLITSKDNYEKFITLLDDFNNFYNNYTIHNNKYNYTYINNKDLTNLKFNIKKLVEEQRNLYNNFIAYINFLNLSKK